LLENLAGAKTFQVGNCFFSDRPIDIPFFVIASIATLSTI